MPLWNILWWPALGSNSIKSWLPYHISKETMTEIAITTLQHQIQIKFENKSLGSKVIFG